MAIPHQLTRRNFLASTAASVAAMSVPAIPRIAANEKMRVAFIGAGGRGGRNLKTMVETGLIDVYALCDVDSRALDLTGNQFPKAKTFRDFRKLYDAIGKELDAVVVSTTEHTHAFATMPALQLGKPVYCEKPLAYNIEETRAVTLAAGKAGVVTQMGTQIHAEPNYHRVVELVRSGAIGEIREVHVWVSRAWGLKTSKELEITQGRGPYVENRPTEEMLPPQHLDWDLWLGPAPHRPYHSVYFPGPQWYRWWDFANGTMSDLGSHRVDLPFWALELDAPETVKAFGIPPHPEIAPASMTAVYQYGARGDLPPVQLTWYQGIHKPDVWNQSKIPPWPNGALFIGSKGMLLADYKKYLLLPEKDFVDFQPPKPFIPPSPGHHEEFLRACRGEGQTGSPFEYAGPLTEANHLGNVAYRVGKQITWDPEKMQCVNCPEAEPFIRRRPRRGWSLGTSTG